jgi:branched-chain amino acid transport system permease protein
MIWRRRLHTRYQHGSALFPTGWHKLGLLVVVASVLVFPLLANDYWLQVGSHALIAVVGAVALMVLTGFAGQISLGHAAFLALGAYTAAVLGERYGVPFWMAIPAAGAVAAAVGLLIGPFALRLEGLYLAIVTLGLLFLVNHVLLSLPQLTHGVSGMAVPMNTWFPPEDTPEWALGDFYDPTTLFGVELRFEQKIYLVFLVISALVVLLAVRLKRSSTGRAMFAVRDHDLAAAVLGVHPARTKIIAFGISSFLAGVAGAMFAYQTYYITVSPPFDLALSIDYVAMIVLGGIGTVLGAVLGALAFVVFHPLAEKLGRALGLGEILSSDQQATLLFTLVVMGFLLFEPLGLVGVWQRIKRYFQAWPFRY